MYLLHTSTFELKAFVGKNVPRYAILSHVWNGDEEISYEEMRCFLIPPEKAAFAFALLGREQRDLRSLSGFQKIYYAMQQAIADGISWLWVDTCCIDKRSSAELSEAINSMFAWYRNAEVCYAYLEDVEDDDTLATRVWPHITVLHKDDFNTCVPFERSRWFYRGWTLQELLAPQKLEFFGRAWRYLGTRHQLASLITRTTQISRDALLGTKPIHAHSVAQRMAWAAYRETTRDEDVAYSLLGIFDIHMPLLYGEGQRAFERLQHEICRRYQDESILAWNVQDTVPDPEWHTAITETRLFASSPYEFRNSQSVISSPRRDQALQPYEITNMGLRIMMRITRLAGKDFFRATLNCIREDQFGGLLSIRLRQDVQGLYHRLSTPLAESRITGEMKVITIATRAETESGASSPPVLDVDWRAFNRIFVPEERKKRSRRSDSSSSGRSSFSLGPRDSSG